ncbi:hypothetical protein L227DRAFT_68921 [Lentinus tigrinus ALCF2SS1-6]|uniref:Peptidase A1 domain-containing protein n=1 Tax=Lentinus tigrinus ALCF2SS1-6 TaxID=1328759 RepID=A0A5C2SCD3_9APHY|nr:hypothetical protein L227DRAFT_68921 [Lentinus tigrinus ALCF2SS1-6]
MSFPECLHWSTGTVSWAAVRIDRFSLGAAYAMTKGFRKMNRINGICGLGPGRVQSGFFGPDGVKPETMLHAIRPLVHRTTPTEPNQGENVRLYVHLRSFEVDDHEQKNWISLNGWPTVREFTESDTFTWSEPIPLCPTGGWDVVLDSLRFMKLDDNGQFSDVENGLIAFPDGLVVTLDIGCSVSWVPAHVLHSIRTAVFPTADNLQREREQVGIGQVPFTVPNFKTGPDGERKSLRLNSWYIVYKFRGMNGADIEVQGPLVPFICAENPKIENPLEREGLLFHLEEQRAERRYVFGANFFQSMYVQLNCSSTRKDCFVKLAPQWNKPPSLSSA